MSEQPSWVKRPPWWAWILMIIVPMFVCCGGPVVLLVVGTFQGLQESAEVAQDRTFRKDEIQVDERGSVTAAKEEPGEHFIEAPKIELGEWRLDTEEMKVLGSPKNIGTVAADIRLKVYYHDAEGNRIGEDEIYSVTLIPGVRVPVTHPTMGSAQPPPGATEKVEVELAEIQQDRLGLLTDDEEAASHAAQLLITEILEPEYDGRIPVKVQVKNTGDKPLIAFRAKLHFQDDAGNEVAAWQIDVGKRGGRAVRGKDWFWTDPMDSIDLEYIQSAGVSVLKPGYIKVGEIRFDHGGPEGWARTVESIQAEILGVLQFEGKE